MIKRPLGLVALCSILVMFLYVNGIWPDQGYPGRLTLIEECLIDGQDCSIEGLVYHKEIKNNKAVYYIKCSSIIAGDYEISNSKVIFLFDSDRIPLYSNIKACGTIKNFAKARNEGNYDEKKYYNSLGLICKVDNGVLIDAVPHYFGGHDILYRFRLAVSSVYKKFLFAEEADLMSAIALGDKSNLDIQTKELFSGVGLAHLLAISGLHVSVVCMSLYNFLRKRGVSFTISGIVSSAVAICFCIMSGASISTIRAIAMFIIMLLGTTVGRVYDSLSALAIVASCLAIQEPMMIINSGFIFSFGTVAIVQLIVVPLQKEYEGFEKNIIGTIALTIGTIPLIAYFYYEIPSYGFIVNLIVVPLLPLLLGLGLLGGVFGLFVQPIGKMILFIVHFMIYILEMVSDKIASLPFSKLIVGKPNLITVILYETILFIIVRILPRITKRIAVKCVIICLPILLLFISSPKGVEIDILDVGQGDGTFIADGNNSFFIDGGSSSINQVGKYRILPFLKSRGIGKIDYWIVSHPDEDHINGLIELLEDKYKVKHLVVAAALKDEPAMVELVDLAHQAGTTIIYMKTGDMIETKRVKLLCLYPNDNQRADNINDMSLCIELFVDNNKDGKTDFSGLFFGDASKSQEEKIIVQIRGTNSDVGQNNHNISFLKVSHHGSKNSSSKEFLEAIEPEVATISCAKKNSYGHPAKEAIDNIESVGTNILYTMDSGQIKFRLNKGYYTFAPML